MIGGGYWAFREFRAPLGGAAEYAGPICYGPGANDEARCFRAHATVAGGTIAGKWQGHDPGITIVLSGEISPAGETKIEMHGENADGKRTFTINLTGRLHGDRLDATGSFLSGRTASLNWRRTGG
jgi:hypothetical protein